jgi:hypothetical protein
MEQGVCDSAVQVQAFQQRGGQQHRRDGPQSRARPGPDWSNVHFPLDVPQRPNRAHPPAKLRRGFTHADV